MFMAEVCLSSSGLERRGEQGGRGGASGAQGISEPGHVILALHPSSSQVFVLPPTAQGCLGCTLPRSPVTILYSSSFRENSGIF